MDNVVPFFHHSFTENFANLGAGFEARSRNDSPPPLLCSFNEHLSNERKENVFVYIFFKILRTRFAGWKTIKFYG